MNRIFTTFVLGFFLILAVSQEKDKKYQIKQVYSVDSLFIEKMNNSEIIVRGNATVPNPCYKYSHYEMIKRDSLIEISPFAKVDPKVNCIQVLGKIKFKIELQIENPGIYTISVIGIKKKMGTTIDIINESKLWDE